MSNASPGTMTGARAVSRLNRGTAGAALLLALACVVDPAHGQITLAQKVTLKQFIGAPSNLRVDYPGGCFPRLTWQDHSFNEAGFEIERSRNGGAWALVVTVGANTTTWSPTMFGPFDSNNCYRVRAFGTNSLGVRYYSTYSNVACAPILQSCLI